MFKLVTIEEDSPEVLLTSLNPAHSPFNVKVKDIAELWKFHSFSSSRLPETGQSIQGLYALVKEIKERLDIEKNSGSGFK